MGKRQLLAERRDAGFTLIEFLIAFGILIIIIGMIIAFSRDFFLLNNDIRDTFLIQRKAQALMDDMIKEIREMAPSSIGGYPLEIKATTSIAFYTNLDTDTLEERVQYFLDGTDLKKSVVKPAGQPLTYATTTAVETLQVVLQDMEMIPGSWTFAYRGKFSTSTAPVDIKEVRLVGIRLSIDKDPNVLPAPVTVSGVVNLRNLRDF